MYRLFPGGRDELVDAVVAAQFARFFGRLYEEVHGATSIEEVLERGLPFARRALLEHEVLQRLLETEPEVLLPKLSLESATIAAMIAGFLVPFLGADELAAGVGVHEAADFLARMILSLISAPGRWDLEDPAQVADLVRCELLAGVVVRMGGP